MRRKSIYIEEFAHGAAPIPAACRIDNVLYTGAVSGYDMATRTHVEGLDAQASLTFLHLRRILAAGGATPDDVVRMTFYVKSPAAREAINGEWVKMFPEPASRPARHVINYETPGNSLLQCDAVAVLPR
jgi:2-iminobutanoate/2-iminopropanoate deaminase